MTATAHAVGRQFLHVDVAAEETAFALQARLGELNRERILPLIERVFDELDVAGVRLRMDRLDLDLGSFTPAQLERDVEKRLDTALRDALESVLRRRDRAAARLVPESVARRELLEHYLLHGTLPSWAGSGAAFSCEELMLALIADDPRAVERLVRTHGRHDFVLERIVSQLSESALHELIRLLEPRHAALILDYVADLQEVHRVEPVLPLGHRDLAHIVWVLVAAYLVHDPGSQFNRKSFVRSLLEGLAASEGLAFAAILAALRLGLERTKRRHPLRSSLPAVMAELVRELDGAPDDPALTVPEPPEPRFSELLASLRPREAAMIERVMALFNRIPAPYRPRPEDRLRQAFLDSLTSIGEAEPLGQSFYAGLLDELFASPLAEPVSRFLLEATAETAPLPPHVREPFRAAVVAAMRRPAGESAELRREVMALLDDGSADAARTLRRQAGDRRTRERWAATLSHEQLLRLAAVLQPRRHRLLLAAADVLAAAWRETAPPGHPALTERAAFWSFMLAFLARNPSSGLSVRRLVGAFFEHSAARYLAAVPDAPELAADGERLLERADRLARVGGQTALRAIFHRDRRVLLAPWSRARRTRMSTRGRPFRPIDETRGEAAPIYIENAGLVLTAPFLPQFFGVLELFTEDPDRRPMPRDAGAATRAVRLLQFLADGGTATPEPLLVLNKVLCGIASGTPVGREYEPSEREREVCDTLLRSMIASWKAIANTSIEGLQQTFLHRPGKLLRVDDGWRVEVQRKTVDFLVDDIPWNVSVICHRWMPQPLYINW
jgi:hypothetical protein